MPKPAPPPSRPRAWPWGPFLLVATLLAYAPAWNGKPLWDDAAHMTKPALRSAAGLVRIWTELGATQQYYPLTHSIFWLQYQVWGEWTAGYHLVNILLHASSALILLAILRRLRVPGAWLAAGLFALHPVMVESVAWITELKNTLSGACYLAAALAYLKFDDERRSGHYAAAFVLLVLGLLAKSVVVTLPAALLVVLWWKRGRVSLWRDVVPLAPCFAVGLVAGLFTAWVERRFIGAQGGAFDFTFVERCLIAGRALWFYLYKLLWPADLIFIYPRWHIDATAAWQFLFPAALLAVAALCWAVRHRARAPLAALLYFAGTLLPALGFFNVYPFLYSFVADHFQYLAAIGPLVAAAAGITLAMGRLEPRWRRWLQPSLHGLLLSTLFLLCWSQSRMYADAERLYRTTVARNDACWMAHTHLGLLLMETGRHDEAMTHLQKAQALHPRQADAHSNLGLLFMDMGRTSEASEQLLKALALDPDHADAHNNLGALLAHDGRLDEAMRHLRQALALHPEHAEIHYNLGDLLARGGRTDEAVAHYQKALALHPGYADAHNNLGLLLAQLGNPTEAMARFRRALELDPGHANAHNNLGVLLAKAGQLDPAIEHHRQALSIDPTQTSHLDNLVSALLRRGRVSEAVSVVERSQATASAAGDEARAAAIARILARLRQAIGAAREAAHSGPPGDLPTR